MEIEYKILNLYKTKQFDECLKLCEIALQDKDDRMIEFIRMRAMTIQAKIVGNGYEEVEYYPQQDELVSTAVAKTPRPGTSFQRDSKTARNVETSYQVGTINIMYFTTEDQIIHNIFCRQLNYYMAEIHL